jgi:hypothetical protein
MSSSGREYEVSTLRILFSLDFEYELVPLQLNLTKPSVV